MKNLFTVILFLALLVFTSVYVYADVWYVDRDKLVSGDGKSWGGAFKFIWEATQFEAQDGDEVWVKRGTHELISPILVITACEIYGGFAGWESMRSQRNPVANVTIIDGMNSVYHCFDVSDHCVIDGFTIKRANCNGASAPADRGGGIYIKSGADITVANCIFRNNSGKWGGAIWSDTGSDTSILNCRFIDNHITYTGGAVYLRPGVVTIDKCDFLSNQGNYAGAVFSDASSTITDCYFESNTANDRGGALVGPHTSACN